MEEENENTNKGIKIFGRYMGDIPCFRDSYFYGICTGVFSGFGYFMFTSRPRHASHFGMATFVLTTLGYWTYCRINLEKQEKEALLLKQYMLEQIAKEGISDPEKVATV